MGQIQSKAPINWVGVVALILVPLVALVLIPWYAYNHDFSVAAWVCFFILLAWNGLSITAGYHRLWSHRAYDATWIVRFVLMVGGTMAMQNSVLFWAAGHRTHHRFVDDEDKDPYAATRGFWFSHMGWMLRNYPSAENDYKNTPDLLKDPMVMFQDKYYVPLTIAANIGIPLALGYAIGDVWGVMLLGGLLRVIVNHHVTFFINSIAHIFGSQPYTDENTARDNGIVALFTWGEGYHNYHHIFQFDYRNGIKWWQYDPTKWLIYGLSKVKLTYNLRRIPRFQIEKSILTMKFKHAEAALNSYGLDFKEDLQNLKNKLNAEYEQFGQSVQQWSKLKEQAIALKKEEISQTFKDFEVKLKQDFKKIELEVALQSDRVQQLLKEISSNTTAKSV